MSEVRPLQRKDLPERAAAEEHDQEHREQEVRDGVAEDDDRRGRGVEARAVPDRLADAERNRDRIGDEGHPHAERDRHRQLLPDELQDRHVAIVAPAEIEGRVVAHQDPEALERGLVEAVLLLELLDEFRIEALRPAIARGDVAAGLRRACADLPAAAAEACARALVRALQLRDRALDRAAGHELHDGEGDSHDAEDRRDHQQEAAQDIGEHIRQSAVGSRRCGRIAGRLSDGVALRASPDRRAQLDCPADRRPPRRHRPAATIQSSWPFLRPTTRCPARRC